MNQLPPGTAWAEALSTIWSKLPPCDTSSIRTASATGKPVVSLLRTTRACPGSKAKTPSSFQRPPLLRWSTRTVALPPEWKIVYGASAARVEKGDDHQASTRYEPARSIGNRHWAASSPPPALDHR
jgi:hypothetical protein